MAGDLMARTIDGERRNAAIRAETAQRMAAHGAARSKIAAAPANVQQLRELVADLERILGVIT